MIRSFIGFALVILLSVAIPTLASQVPFGSSTPNIPISSRDRVYSADQYSNTVSVQMRSLRSLAPGDLLLFKVEFCQSGLD
jgi:hypothetical protein